MCEVIQNIDEQLLQKMIEKSIHVFQEYENLEQSLTKEVNLRLIYIWRDSVRRQWESKLNKQNPITQTEKLLSNQVDNQLINSQITQSRSLYKISPLKFSPVKIKFSWESFPNVSFSY